MSNVIDLPQRKVALQLIASSRVEEDRVQQQIRDLTELWMRLMHRRLELERMIGEQKPIPSMVDETEPPCA